MLNALTIDVEDYYQVTAFEGQIKRRYWEQFPSRVVQNTRRILDILERHQVRATFFILGWVGQHFPGLVRDIAQAGHEIGCHSFWHRLIYGMTPREFRKDLRMARDVLEQSTGSQVTAYRAPSFSITKQSLWALDILAEEGFRYDSSIFPIYHDRYGIPDAEPSPHRLERPSGTLWEFPPSVVRFWKVNFPVAGGGYFRLYPLKWMARFFRRLNRDLDRPFLFYIHPWELDPDQPRLQVSRFYGWRHYVNLCGTEQKLDWLLGHFRFDCLSESLNRFIEQRLAPAARVVAPALAY